MDNNNFNLFENSPCINSGNPDFPTDSNNINSDIGAIAYNNNCLLEGDANNDSIITVFLGFRYFHVFPTPKTAWEYRENNKLPPCCVGRGAEQYKN